MLYRYKGKDGVVLGRPARATAVRGKTPVAKANRYKFVMDILRIRLLGGFEMERGGMILSPPPTPKSRSLLAYMILHRDQLTHREILCATLWPDEAEAVARKALRTALWRVRSALDAGGDRGDPYIYGDAYQVGFRGAAPVWVDVWDYEDVLARVDRKVDTALDAADGEAMAGAAMLYRGQCAAGVYDEWLAVEQARLQEAQLALLERIAVFHAGHQRWLQAIGWAERVLAADPLREHLHRILMSCHMSMGDRPSALRQYARCEAVLRTELDIEPMDETMALRDQIQGSLAERASDSKHGPRPVALPKPLKPRDAPLDREIESALATLRQVARRLDHARNNRRGRNAPRAR